MTNRIRHYHLGCGESLQSHYSMICNELQLTSKQTKKPAKRDAAVNDKRVRVKS